MTSNDKQRSVILWRFGPCGGVFGHGDTSTFYIFGSIESVPLLDIKRLPLEDKSIIVFRHRRRIHAVVSTARRSTQARKPRSGPVPKVWVARRKFDSVELV